MDGAGVDDAQFLHQPDGARCRRGEQGGRAPGGILTELNFWVTCETSEDVSYLIDVLGDDNLLVGSDYGHPDRASIRDAQGLMFQLPGVKELSADKMTKTNGASFYGLSLD